MTNAEFSLSPDAAVRVYAACTLLTQGLSALITQSRTLNSTDGSGSFPSGSKITASLRTLGSGASDAVTRWSEKSEETRSAAKSAGNLLDHQEQDNASKVASAPSSSHGGSVVPDLTGYLTGNGGDSKPSLDGKGLANLMMPNTSQQQSVPTVLDLMPILMGSKPKSPLSTCEANPDSFGLNVAPEATAGITLDSASEHMSTADAAILTRLAGQWKQIGTALQTEICPAPGSRLGRFVDGHQTKNRPRWSSISRPTS